MAEGFGELSGHAAPALLILISLAAGPKHGYAMMEDIRAVSGTRLGPGTLYGALARLERLGLIEAEPVAARRRPYRLTEAGATVLKAEVATLQRLAEAGRTRLEAPWAAAI